MEPLHATRCRLAVLMLVLLRLPSPDAVSGQSAAVEKHNISELSWIAGDWQTAPGGRTQIEEHWTQPAGGSMVGTGRTVAGARTVEFEFLRLEQRGEDIYYVAQ